MIRTPPLALCLLLAAAGCGAREEARQDAAANTAAPAEAGDEVEALPSDGLAAPEGMTLDSESGDGAAAEANAVDGVSGGNAM